MPPKPTRTGEYIETDNGNKISRRAQLHSTQHIILAGKSVIQHDVVIRGDLVRQQPPSSSTKATPLAPSGKASSSSQTVSIHLGRYVFISPGCTLHPPSRLSSSQSSSSATTTTNTALTSGPTTQKNIALTSTPSELAARRASAQAPLLSPLSTAPPSFPPLLNPSSTSPLSPTSPTLPAPPLPIASTQSPTQVLTHYPLRLSSYVYVGPSTTVSAASIGSHVYIGARCTIGNMVIIKDNVRVEDDTVLPAGSVWRSGVVVAGRPGRVVGRLGEGAAADSGASGGGGGGDGFGAGGGKGVEGLVRELWASVGNHVKK